MVYFIKQIANSFIWGPILWVMLDKSGSANQPKMNQLGNFPQFSKKNPNENGFILRNNFQTHVFGAPYFGPFTVKCGPFEQMVVFAGRPQMDQF